MPLLGLPVLNYESLGKDENPKIFTPAAAAEKLVR
jgi:hypothetical protein